MSQFLDAYIECALWSSTYDDGDGMGSCMDDGEHELSDDAREQMEEDCNDFLAMIEASEIDRSEWDDAELGHDFWLSRNGHGTGFWDRGKAQGNALHKLAKAAGSADLYIGDDGLIYQS